MTSAFALCVPTTFAAKTLPLSSEWSTRRMHEEAERKSQRVERRVEWEVRCTSASLLRAVLVPCSAAVEGLCSRRFSAKKRFSKAGRASPA